MAQKSLFWSTGVAGDGLSAYSQDDMFAWLKRTFGDGIKKAYGGDLVVSGTASPVSVAAGAAVVNGAPYENTTAVTVAVPTPTAGTTAHRVVLRWSDTLNTVRIALVSATDGVSTPPALTTTPPVYEVLLADLTITTGGVISVVNHPPFLGQRSSSLFTPATFGLDTTTATWLNGTLFGIKMAKTDLVTGYANFLCPSDYASGLTMAPVFLGSVFGGNARISAEYAYGAAGEIYNQHSATQAEATLAVTANQRSTFTPTSLASITPGDYVLCNATRNGPHASDTLDDDLFLLGFLISYTAAS
jgi:hypothetical protein